MAGVDRLGTGVGIACALHCLLGAIVPSMLVAVGAGVLLSEAAEWSLIGTAVIVATVAAPLGFRRHRSPWIVAAFALAVALLLAGRLLEDSGMFGTVAAILGGIAVASAHFANLRASSDGKRDDKPSGAGRGSDATRAGA